MLELYFDESGNTGTNYLDNKQPYFVYGGWLIKYENSKEICKRIQQIFCESKARELKAKNKLNYGKIKELFDMMMFDFGAMPVFGVADKKYMVAAKIIETFFDHMYNPNVNGCLTFKTELKKALADSISSNDDLLIEFSRIIHDGTLELEAMRKIDDKLSEHFKKESLFDVQKSISGLSDLNLQEMIEEFEFISRNGTEKRWLTLVEPVLIDRLYNVGLYSEIIGEKVDFYVDELWGYQNVFEELSSILNKERIIKNVRFVKQCKSDENLLIQAADLLCGFVSSTLNKKEVLMKNEMVNWEWQNFLFLESVFDKYRIKIWDYYAHSDFIYEILSLSGYTGKKGTVDCNKVIERDFWLALHGNDRWKMLI